MAQRGGGRNRVHRLCLVINVCKPEAMHDLMNNDPTVADAVTAVRLIYDSETAPLIFSPPAGWNDSCSGEVTVPPARSHVERLAAGDTSGIPMVNA